VFVKELRRIVGLLTLFEITHDRITLNIIAGEPIFDRNIVSIVSLHYAEIRGKLDQIYYDLLLEKNRELYPDFNLLIWKFYENYNGMSEFDAFGMMTYLVQRISFFKDWIIESEKSIATQKRPHLLLQAGK
jgi:hypothetical protein